MVTVSECSLVFAKSNTKPTDGEQVMLSSGEIVLLRNKYFQTQCLWFVLLLRTRLTTLLFVLHLQVIIHNIF